MTKCMWCDARARVYIVYSIRRTCSGFVPDQNIKKNKQKNIQNSTKIYLIRFAHDVHDQPACQLVALCLTVIFAIFSISNKYILFMSAYGCPVSSVQCSTRRDSFYANNFLPYSNYFHWKIIIEPHAFHAKRNRERRKKKETLFVVIHLSKCVCWLHGSWCSAHVYENFHISNFS